MKKGLLLLTVFVCAITGFAQNLEYTKYNWEENIDIEKYNLKSEEGIISYKEHYQKEFYLKGDNFFEIDLTHQLMWLNSDEAIENYNKVYLPYDNTSELVLSKARVIKADGTIIELPEDKILTAKDEETNREYKYYAVEGIEKGCFVEYIYAIKKIASYKGNRLVLQSDHPKKNISFELFAPKAFIFEFLTEELPDITLDEENKDEEKNKWGFKEVAIEPLIDEVMAPYGALKKSIVYKLDRTLYKAGNGISSYDTFAQTMFGLYYGDLDKKDGKVLKKIVSNLKLKDLNTEEQVRAIENYLKKEFFLQKNYGIRSFGEIYETKSANEYEMVKLFVQLCEVLEIKTELVFTSNRYNLRFHPTFEAGNFLQEFLLYFPKLKKYTSPSRASDRLGFPLYSYMENYGLFVKKVELNGLKTAVAKVKYIKPLSSDKSIAIIEAKVSFDEDFTTSNIDLTRTFSGYKAYYYQPYMHYLTDEKKKDVVDELLKFYGEDVKVIDYKVENDQPELYGVKPLIVSGNVTSDGLITKAGNKFIFKIGDLIGPQMEMYQVTERKLPCESYHNKKYIRKLEIEIPEGYEVKNLEGLNIEEYFNEETKLNAFVSLYKVEGNLLTVDVTEYYDQIVIEPKDFDDYKRVINAAADFNKVSVVFVKK